jgi:hypothetical protein
MSEPLPPSQPEPTEHPFPPPVAPTVVDPSATTAPQGPAGPPPWRPDRPGPAGYPQWRGRRSWWLPGLLGLLIGLAIGCGGVLLGAALWTHGDGFRHAQVNSRVHHGPFGPRFGPGEPGPRFGPRFGQLPGPGTVTPSTSAVPQPTAS